jgi:hypothetical protein
LVGTSGVRSSPTTSWCWPESSSTRPDKLRAGCNRHDNGITAP